jgi:FkbM family methyltransferase
MKLLRSAVYYFYSIFEMLFGIKNWPRLIAIFLSNKQKSEALIVFRRPPVRMFVRGKMDVWSLKETILDSFYTRYGVQIKDGWQIIDIGAGIGDFSINAAYNNPNVVVHAFEPFPESFALLKKNILINDIQNVLAYQKAVWSHEDVLALDLSLGEPLKISSSINNLNIKSSSKLEVEAISLSQLVCNLDLEKIDLLKLDCEGAEYEILMNSSSETLSRINRIVMEYHDIDENQQHNRLVNYLESHGYQVRCQNNFVHDDIGYLFAQKYALII